MDHIGSKTLEIMSASSWYNKWLVGRMKKHIKGDILEVGAGIGNITPLISKFGTVWAIDINRMYLSRLKKKKFKAGFGDIEKGSYFFGNKKFDTVISTNVLEHIENDEKALKNMSRLLKKGGKMVLLVPAGKFAYGELDKNLGHFRRYSKSELVGKVRNTGLKVEKARFLNFLGIFGWFVNGRILRRKILPKKQMKLFDIFARPLLTFEKFIKFPVGLSLLAIARKN